MHPHPTTPLYAASVTLPLESWRFVTASLLEHASQLKADGKDRLARELVNRVLPVTLHASCSATLEECEQRFRDLHREYLDPAARTAARPLVRFVPAGGDGSSG